ncbi:MAG: hypothetical protein WAU28_03745 [Candidatus Moraniibacteriota bacterium]
MLYGAYAELIGRVNHIVQWEQRYKRAFGLHVDFEQLLIPIEPLVPHTLIVDARELHTRTLLNKCRELFGLKLTGSFWPDERSLPQDPRIYSFANHLNNHWRDYGGSRPKGSFISSDLATPRGKNGKQLEQFEMHDVEQSRCISLREYLLYLVLSWQKKAEEGKQKSWKSPHSNFNIWCLGSYFQPITSARHFHPMIYWEHGEMRIDCSEDNPRHIKTATIYVYRTSP